MEREIFLSDFVVQSILQASIFHSFYMSIYINYVHVILYNIYKYEFILKFSNRKKNKFESVGNSKSTYFVLDRKRNII